jgi:hypothetical protein
LSASLSTSFTLRSAMLVILSCTPFDNALHLHTTTISAAGLSFMASMQRICRSLVDQRANKINVSPVKIATAPTIRSSISMPPQPRHDCIMQIWCTKEKHQENCNCYPESAIPIHLTPLLM